MRKVQDSESNNLVPLRVEHCGELAFVCNNSSSSSLAQWLGSLPETFTRHRDTNWDYVYLVGFEVACNWKLLLENALEASHTDTVHHATLGQQS